MIPDLLFPKVMHQTLMSLILLLLDVFLAIGGIVLLVTTVQELQQLAPLDSRLISRASISELLITSVSLLAVASILSVLFAYFIVKGRRNRFAMFTVCSLAIAVFVAELTLGIFFLIFFHQVKDYVHHDLERCIPYYRIEQDFKHDWDVLHRKFNCCGNKSYQDFKISSEEASNITKCEDIPESCYRSVFSANSSLEELPNNCSLTEEGCVTAVSEFIRNKSAGLGTVFVFQSIVWLTISVISGFTGGSIKLRLKLEEKTRRLAAVAVANHLHDTPGGRF